jgi:hypothetical protein
VAGGENQAAAGSRNNATKQIQFTTNAVRNIMYKTLFSLLLVTALILGACGKESTLVSPSTDDQSSSLSLTKSQEGELTDILLLGEDPSAIMSESESSLLSSFICDVAPSLARHGHDDARRYVDIAAIMYLRAALRADSTVTDEQRTAIETAIDASTTTRAAIFADSMQTAAERAAALKSEHERLMTQIAGANGAGGILTADQVAKTEALLAKIEAERQLHHAEMLEKRIAAQIAKWNVTLAFTDAQKLQIADLLRTQDANIQAARAQYQYDPEGYRAAVLVIQTATQAGIRAILDDTQKPLWDQIVASGWKGWTDGGGRGGHHGHRHG